MGDESIGVKIDVDTGSAEKNLNDLSGAVNANASSVVNLRKQYKTMQRELEQLDPNTEEFEKLSRQMGRLKDQMGDAAEAARANAGNAFEGLSGNAQLLGGRLANLDFEGVGSALRGMAGNLKSVSFSEFSGGIKSMIGGLGSLGKALLTNPIFLLVAAIGGIVAYSDELLSLMDGVSGEDEKQLKAQQEKAALAKEQVDAVSAQEEILKQQGKTEKEIQQMKLNALTTAITEQEIVIQTQKTQKDAQVAAAKRNADILKGILMFLTAPLQILLYSVDQVIAGLNAVGVISDETYASIGSLQAGLNDSVAKLLFDPAAVAAEGDKTLKESERALTALKNQKAGIENKITADENKARDDRNTANAKANEERLKKEQEIADAIAKLKEEQYQQTLSATDKELRAVELKYTELLAKAQGNATQTAELTKLWEAEKTKITADAEADRLKVIANANAEANKLRQEAAMEAMTLSERADEDLRLSKMTQQQVDLDALRTKYFEESAVLEQQGYDTAALTEVYEGQVKEINDKYRTEKEAKDAEQAEKDKARAEEIANARIGTASSMIGALSSLNEAFAGSSERDRKRSFKRNKALQIAQALIQTYQSATAAYASQLTVPSPDAPIRAAIAAGAAVASGLAQVASIRKTEYAAGSEPPGGSSPPPSVSGGGGGGGESVPQAANLNLGFLNNRPEQMRPSYVLSGDVKNANDARDKVERLARVG